MMKSLVGIMWIVLVLISGCSGNPDAKRLYDDLLSNYNKLVRPVVNVTDALTVKIKLKLSQLIDVNLKNQIMTTNLWVEQSWYDYKLKWDPKEYGGVEMLHVPSDHIWRPDIVLYNNADGNFEVTLATKATLNYTGRVEWKPPAIYKSSCEIDVEYFPFDEQTCVMKFGSWTYDGFQVDLRHIDEIRGKNVVDIGVDLSEFYTSVEWDILEVPAVRNEKFYTCCDEPYLDITFNITMRRKTLFYTVNLIIPCMGISFLTVLVFYLPSDSGEKVSLSISILLSLTVFFLLLAEIIPPTSLVVPLLGKFVLFTMILDTFSICVTVVVLNVHFRSPQTHVMAPWVRRVFIHVLPRLLVMRRPQYQIDKRSMGSHHGQRVMVRTCNGLELRDPSLFVETSASELVESSVLFPSLDSRDELHPRELEAVNLGSACRIHGSPATTAAPPQLPTEESVDALCNTLHHWHHCPEIYKAIEGIRFIADHTKREEDSTRVKEDWKYVAMVLDRLFLWIFTLAVVVGTAGIILQAPTLYDDRIPIDVRLSEIASTTAKPHIVTSL
ncbi:nicotinic acetylcholine receptor alpha3 subunit isoform X2 [Apis mellifera]|uniref:Nicotinic acetylcholine receptor alpha3 subunit isoform X2 n=1 Tax=Apis mellifera TaxID=7460 RepID=A0A7M7IFZ3_APIME|nr:nicotinic acetylcholine receptor alpha3 subunit isoform X2 [Apis mellifera]|eukprot:XP_016767553.1 nicotinic acetylcholine receptor alpha3 subunit isoform X2 [Apis mellifera]